MSKPITTWSKLEETTQNKRFIDIGIKNQREDEQNKEFLDPLEIVTSSEANSDRSTKYRQKNWDIAQIISSSAESAKKISVSQEEFSATYFLANVHDKTPYLDFLGTPKTVEEKMEDQQAKIRKLVRENFSQFRRAKDALDEVYSTKDAIFTTNSIEKLTLKYQDVQTSGENLFSPLWKRKQEIEEIKQVTSLFQKYNFIFSLPDEIKKNIKERDFKKVVHDYEKGKFFKKRLKTNIFSRTFEAIETEIKKLREDLFLELNIDKHVKERHLKSMLNEQEKIIIYLYALDADVDPAETYLKNLVFYVSSLLENAIQSQHELLSNDPIVRDKLNFHAIKKLTETLLTKFPLINELAQNILTGKFQKRGGVIHNKLQMIEQKELKQNKISELINENIISTYSQKIEEVISHIDRGFAHQDVLFESIKECMDCNNSLLSLNIPKSFTKQLNDFTNKLKKDFVMNTCIRTMKEIGTLYESEDFTINEKSITNSPILFKAKLEKFIEVLSHFVTKNDVLMGDITKYYLKSIASFADCIHALAFPVDDYVHQSDEHLLVLLNNCTYTKNNILSSVTFKFIETFYFASIAHYQKDVQIHTDEFINSNIIEFSLYQNLENFVIDAFVQRRSIALLPFYNKGIHLAGYDWKKSLKPTEIRSFVLEILVDLALIHSEVEKYAKAHTEQIFKTLYEIISQLFEQYIRFELDEISENAAFQLDIEFEFIQRALAKYETNVIVAQFLKLQKHLDQISGYVLNFDDESLKTEIIRDFSEKTRVQLNCFDIKKL
eukprot:gene6085-10093_t